MEIWSVVISGLEFSVSILSRCDRWVLIRTINTLHHDLIIRMDKEGQRLTNCSPLNLIIRKQHSVRLHGGKGEIGKDSVQMWERKGETGEGIKREREREKERGQERGDRERHWWIKVYKVYILM